MSLIQAVTALIEEAGQGTVDTLLPDLPGYTRKQVMSALQNAQSNRLIHLIGKAGAAAGRANQLATYGPGPKPGTAQMSEYRNGWKHGRVASVWDLGQGLTR